MQFVLCFEKITDYYVNIYLLRVLEHKKFKFLPEKDNL